MGSVTDDLIRRDSIHKALRASNERIELTPTNFYDVVGASEEMTSGEFQDLAETIGWIEIEEPSKLFTYGPTIGPYWVLLDIYQRNHQPIQDCRVLTPVSEVAKYLGVPSDILKQADNGEYPLSIGLWIEYLNKLEARIYLNTWVKDLL